MRSKFTQGKLLAYSSLLESFPYLISLLLAAFISIGTLRANSPDGFMANCTELFISEYVEGSSNNKAIEIYNPTSMPITLDGNYELIFYFNGNMNPGTVISLTGTIDPYDVFVVADDNAAQAILDVADQVSNMSFFNGDDAIELFNTFEEETVDVIGQIGFDPGSEWGMGLASTQNNTIRRMASVGMGDTNGADVFDPATEWDGYENDTFDGLGEHVSTACPAMAGCSGLFISEYVEGSSNNKAVEIYNASGSTIDLTDVYELRFYFNGSNMPGTTIALNGSIASYDVFVVADNNASAGILAVTDQQSASSFFNGDDAVELYNLVTGSSVDVIGQIGVDPGSEWGMGLTSTQNNTIRRQFGIIEGDSDGTNMFDPADEWDGYAQDNIDDLGQHVSACACDAYTATISGSGAFCGEGNVEITLTTDGGMGPYTLVLEDAQGNTYTRTVGMSGGTTGIAVTENTTFTLLSVEDGVGCPATTLAGSASVVVSPDDLSITGVETDPSCANNDGEIDITVMDGESPYTYAWTGNGVNASAEDQTGLGAGTYTVIVTDAGTCTATESFTLDPAQNCNCNILVSSDVTDEDCNNLGSIQFTASNGDAPYTYNLNGEINNTGLFENLSANTYTVQVSDNSGCSTSATATVNFLPDTAPPMFQQALPADMTFNCDEMVPDPASLTAIDNCDGPVVVNFSEETEPGNCPWVYTAYRSWTATDMAGNSTSHEQVITVVDNAPPVFNLPLPADMTVACDEMVPLPQQVTAQDNCDPGQVPPVIFINEIHYDNAGTDQGEFIEIAGTAGIDLSAYALVLYNGNGGVEYDNVTLSGLIDDEGAGFGAVDFQFPSNGIQNGSPDGIALVELPNTVVQFISYEGTFTATNGPAAGLSSIDIGVFEDFTTPAGFSVQLTGTGQVYDDFLWGGPLDDSPGSLNAGQTINPLAGTIIAMFMETTMMGDCAGEMIIKRSWTAADACGNTTMHMITITKTDGAAPEFVPPLPQDITLNCDEMVPDPADLLATDNCDDGMSGMNMVWINEFHYDNAGGDVGEFIEVAGTAGTDLSDYSLFLYNGNGGGSYGSMTLSGVIDNESNGFGAVSFSYPSNGIQNGSPDGIALVHAGMVVQFLSYEGSFTAVGGPANGMMSTDIGVAESSSTPVGESLQLIGMGSAYADFSWTGPVAESPGSINAGQVFIPVQVGLEVDFNETTSSGPCAYDQTITRTWTVEDDCGNENTHTQVITVTDNMPPVVSCDPINVNLDIDGMVTIDQSDITYSATDNCSPNSALTLLPASITISCDDEGGDVNFEISVEDECGNVGTCDVVISVPVYERCTPEISISDPCVCLNNGTNLTNSQFGEEILIQSLTGKTWMVTAVTGLYASNSPNPPAAPVPVAIGTFFTEFPAGSGDYYLTGRHIDAIGYSITVESESGEILQIGNQCAYPNPEILSDLSGEFCLFSDPVDLIGTPGDQNFVSAGFTINGNPATVFDPAALGVGAYHIEYTVDGGVPKANGPDDPGCVQTIGVFVNVVETPTTVSCNDQVNISLDQDCQYEIQPDDVLEGTYGCFDDYEVHMDVTLPFGNGPWIPAIVDGDDIGETYQVRVTHLVSGNMCWGEITVEDKLAPEMECVNVELSCAIMDPDPDYLLNVLGIQDAYPHIDENCGGYTLNHSDTWFDLGCNGVVNGMQDLSAYILREWVVTDESGNQNSCTQYLYFTRRHVDDVLLPADVTVSCENPNTDPTSTGMPYLMEFGLQFGLYPNNSYCELQTVFEDQVLPVCDGTYKILRTWTIYDWCLPTNPNPPDPNPLYHIQVIKVEDADGPEIQDCPEEVVASVDPFNCCGTIDLPDVTVSDVCSRIDSAHAKIVGFDFYTQDTIGVFHVSASAIADFPGNNHWDPDTLVVFGNTPCLPRGNHHVYYYVTDDCGNSSVCSFDLIVSDLVPPTVACDEFTQVALGVSGEAFVNATTFDDGSYDNCSIVNFKARRMVNNGCQSASFFHDQVKFCCEDVGDTIQVVLRVYDVDVPAGQVSQSFQEQHSNDCMVEVFVEDKIKPVCLPPAHATVECENFDPSLWAYGMADGEDNCCIDTVTTITSYTNFDTLCNKGTILRTFRVFDCYQNSSLCTQRIIVNYIQDYYVKFPNDVIVNECDGTGMYGEPEFFGEDCEIMGVSFEDEIFTVVPDACYKIERTWDVINWCTYNPNLPYINVPNPNPNATSNHPSNLPGPIVSPSGTAQPWNPTIVKINPNDPLPTNYSTFWLANANGYRYKQIIKIIDGEAPVYDNCPNDVEVCDVTENDALFWNDADYWDASISSHDLCEAPSELCITVTDSCGGSAINIRYILFLDIDGDGLMETEISSTNPPAPNEVPYLGGTPFDHRPVPFNQKYRFTIDWTDTGNARTACVRWDWLQQPVNLNDNLLQGDVPQLPYGTHKIKWIAEDGCGNEAICEYTFEVKDCKKPTVVCLNGLSVNIMPTGMITLWGSDFLQYGEDNCTPADQLIYGVIKSSESTGSFPLDPLGNPISNVTFDCDELGTQPVQLWAMDAAGNADFCETYLIVQDNMGMCGGQLSVAGILATELDEGVEEGDVELSGSHQAIPPFSLFDLTDNAGWYEFSNAIPLASNIVITPLKDDNPLNGVTTFDLVLISKHILGLQPLDSPYKMIAADANKSNSITTFDIVELRKMILGIYNELPNNTSWRFVDEEFQFSDPNNPFLDNFPETKTVADVQQNQMDDDFVAVKVGDVNNSVIANSLLSSDDRTSGTLYFELEDREVAAGELIDVQFTASQQVLGYQFTLNLKGLQLVDVLPGAEMGMENFGIFENTPDVEGSGALTTSFNGNTRGEFSIRFKANKSGLLSSMLGISSSITKAEAYTPERYEVALRFDGGKVVGHEFEVYQNIPNPWISNTMIGFYLPEAGQAILNVYDNNGRLLFNQKGDFDAGYNQFILNRSQVSSTSAMYYEITSESGASTLMMVQTR